MTAIALNGLAACLAASGPTDIRDDLTVRIRRTPRASGAPLPAHEARWVGSLRRTCAGKLRRAALPGLIDPVGLVISELVTNGLVHGTGEELAVRFLLTTRQLVIEVADGSPGRARVRVAAPEDESGRGMALVDAIADAWDTSPDGTTTWCSFALPGSKP